MSAILQLIKTKRFVSIVGLGILVFVVVLVLVNRVEKEKQRFYQAQDQLRLYRTEVWHMKDVDEAALAQELADQTKRFPTKEKVVSLIQELNHIARLSGVTIDSLSPGNTFQPADLGKWAGPELEEVPIELKARGIFQNISTFVSSLAHLDYGLIDVRHFELNPKAVRSQDLVLSLSGVFYIKKIENALFAKSGDAVEMHLLRPKPRSRFNDYGRDPFSGLSVKAKTSTVIEGIIYDPQKPIVVIGGDIKHLGDEVNGSRIIEIKPSSVVFEKDGARSEVTIAASKANQPSQS